jgi:multiple sugar transport system permease protein
MSASAAKLGSGPRSQSRRAARRAQAEAAIVPIRLYGLRRGTVTLLTLASALFGMFIIAPFLWLFVNATKTQSNVYESFGFWFARPFVLWHNLSTLFQNVSGAGVYMQWLGNTVLYALVGGAGSTVLCALAGYGFAR